MFKHVSWKLIGILVAGTVVVGAAAVYWIANRAAPPRYVTIAVTQGDVVTTITASGSVNPVVVVEVGTYVSGTIETLSCDYNTRVHKGQLCAKIDPKPYQVVVDQDQADLDVVKAQLVKDRANVVYTKITHERDDLLYSEDSISHDAADAALNAYNQAVALVDLSESDIAGAAEGANASFSVDAFPNRTFQGRVAQVRQAPVSVQNVITYDVVITVDNLDLALKPGMTATARIVTAQSLNVLRVPSQALRFTPAAAAKLGLAKRVKSGQGVIWVERAGKLVSIPVTVGLVDDTYAEIKAGDLHLGDQVVTSEATAGAPQVSSAPSLKL